MGQPNLDQENFRVGNDDGSESAHGWLGTLGQDLNIGPGQTIADGEQMFLRFTIANTGAKVSSGFIPSIEISYNGGAYATIGATGAIKYATNVTYLLDGTDTTDRLGGTGTFDTSNVGVIEGAAAGASNDLANGTRMEVLIVLEVDQAAMVSNGDYYDIRVTNNGADLDAWTDTPRFTVANLPVSVINQAGYRFTSNDGTLASPTWEAAANTNVTLETGLVFQLWVELEETGSVTKNVGYELTWQKNGTGGYTTLPGVVYSAPTSLPNGIWGVISDNYAHGDAITSNPIAQSAKTFTNGHGVEDTTGDVESNAVSLNNQATVLAFTVRIPSLTDTADSHSGDYFDIQVRYADGTAIDSTLTARVTLGAGSGHIGGCPAETQGKMGPFMDTNSRMWYISERNEVTNHIVAMYSDDDGLTWYYADNDTGITDLESCDIVQDGDTLHIFADIGGSVEYIPFYMSDHATLANTFGTQDTVVASKTENDQGCAAVKRTSDYVVFYRNGTTSEEIYYVIGTPGSWGTPAQLDSTNVNHIGIHAIKGADSDWIHIFYTDEGTPNNIRHRSMDPSDDTLTASQVVYNNSESGGSGWQWGMTAAEAWMSGTDDIVGIVMIDDTNNYPYFVSITNDGTPASAVQIDNVTISNDPGAMTSRSPVGRLIADSNGTLYFLMADATSEDLYIYTSTDDGATWTNQTTPVELLDGKTIEMIIGTTLTLSGTEKICYIYADQYGGYTDWVYFGSTDIESIGQTQNVNQITETNTANAFTSAKAESFLQITETQTAQSITAQRVYEFAQAVDSLEVLAMTAYRAYGFTQITETNTANAFTSAKLKEIAQIAETLLAQAMTAQQGYTFTVNQISETNTANAFTSTKLKSLAQALDTLLAQTISSQRVYGVTQVTQASTANQINISKQLSFLQASDSLLAQGMTPIRAYLMGQATDTLLAQAFSSYKQLEFAIATETPIAQPFAAGGATVFSQVQETDLAQALTSLKAKSFLQVTETQTAQGFGTQKVIIIQQAAESGVPTAMAISKTRAIAQAIESDLAQAFNVVRVESIGQATDSELAQAMEITGIVVIVGPGNVRIITADGKETIYANRKRTIKSSSRDDILYQ